jgi:hypothetical protein
MISALRRHDLRAADDICKASLHGRKSGGTRDVSDVAFDLLNSHLAPHAPEQGSTIVLRDRDAVDRAGSGAGRGTPP